MTTTVEDVWENSVVRVGVVMVGGVVSGDVISSHGSNRVFVGTTVVNRSVISKGTCVVLTPPDPTKVR